MGNHYSQVMRARAVGAVDEGPRAFAPTPLFQAGISYIYRALGHRKATVETNSNISVLFSDLDQNAVEDLEREPFPFIFSVVSWGCAATDWLAKVLNSHFGILCFHHADLYWERHAGLPRLDTLRYLKFIGVTARRFSACGDVHGVPIEAVDDLRASLGNKFNCAILIREPLPRLRSQVALFESYLNSPFKTAWEIDYVENFIDRGVRLPQDNIGNRLFLHGVNMLNNIIKEETVASIWRCEDITSDSAALTRFVEELTRGHVQVEPEWAERAVCRPPTNSHCKANAQREFEAWQIEAIKKIVKPQAWWIYEKLGYNTPEFAALADAG